MHEYKIGLALVKVLNKDDKGLDERKDFIESQIKNYNSISKRSLINPKHIGLGKNNEDNIILTKSTLIITLYSYEELNTPGKAIRLLSQLLINPEEPDNLADLLFEKKLFRSFKVATINSEANTKNIVDISDISDSTLIKALVDFVCNQQDFSAQKRTAVDKMKEIAVEGGLL